MMKLVEEYAGVGDLMQKGEVVRRVHYRISRYQGLLEGSGMPIPGLHRIEGTIDVDAGWDTGGLVGASLVLRLADGRTLPITMIDPGGRILSEGHGPLKCTCC
ncbi:MAG: hypothetical protein HY701_14830 [Gemmatimonadetes bacterium]|nr:hypothetical protein [Gemmatimonadota bacterium]